MPQLEEAALKSLHRDPRTTDFAITVDAADGVITLRGVVETLESKQAAEQDALDTVGVSSVKNRLRVRTSEQLEDRVVADEIRRSLAADSYTNRYNITVAVSNGIALLQGTVDNNVQHSEAVLAASKVKGVVDILDRILVLGTPSVPPSARPGLTSLPSQPLYSVHDKC